MSIIGFGERLKTLRLERKLTMEQIANIVGVAKSSYAGHESEFRHPSLEKLTTYANFFEVSVDYLLGLTDSREIDNANLNAKDVLNSKDLHWDGITLGEEELKPIRELLELVSERRVDNHNRKNKNMG